MRCAMLAAGALFASASVCQAQQVGGAELFEGAHVGVEAGAVDHHFVVTETGSAGSSDRNVTKWGAGGAVFAGYDVAIGDKLVAGLEGAVQFGGRTPSTSAGGQRFAIAPRWGYSAIARIGYAVGPQVLLYGGGGYGAHDYRLDVPPGSAEFGEWNRSFVLTAGAEFRVGGAALRASFQHLDGTRNQAMLGLLARF